MPAMWLRKSGCHTFHVPQFHQGEERDPAHLGSGFWNLHSSSLRRGITSLSSLSGLGCVVLQCWEEAFYLNFSDLTLSRCSANIKQDGKPPANWALGSGAGARLRGSGLTLRHWRNMQGHSWVWEFSKGTWTLGTLGFQGWWPSVL